MLRHIVLIITLLQLLGCISEQDRDIGSQSSQQMAIDSALTDLSLVSTTNDSYLDQNDMYIDQSDMLNVTADSGQNLPDDYGLDTVDDASLPSMLEDQSASILDMEQVVIDQAVPAVYRSTLRSNRQYSFDYDRSVTGGNPFKGFTTNYAWGEPANDLGHSLEFKYIPLSAIIDEFGNYNFETSLESSLNEANARGHHLIVRVYLDYPALESGVPLNIRDQVSCQEYDDYGGGCSPNYSDSQLQSLILNFIQTFGMQYDGDRRIGFIQIGLLGFWGEWHTYPHIEWFADDAFQQNVITAFDEAFSITPIQLRIPAQDSPSREIGFHDDSFGYSTVGTPAWFFWPRLLGTMADQRWQIAPMGGEVYPPLQATLFTNAYEFGQYSQDPFSTIQTTHMTYLINYQAFNLNGVGYTGSQRSEAERAAQAMGYEYTVETVEIEASNLADQQVDLQVTVRLRNSGVAPFYYPLTMKLSSNNSEQSWDFDSNLESIIPSSSSSDIVLNILGIAVSEFSEGLTLSLRSPHLLETQVIHWANTQQDNGKLSIMNEFACLFESSSFGLSDQVITTQGECYCDVDGQLYTLEGQICLD